MQPRGTHSAWVGTAVALLLLAGPALAEPLVPAELPPPEYRGQQYVDSRGCLFLRAGAGGGTEWIPRVTRKGEPLCGNPPSGTRVPVVGEAGVDDAVVGAAVDSPTAPEVTAPLASDVPGIKGSEGHLVAVGSFAVAENAGRAAARLRALNYPVAEGRLGGSDGPVTIFAGPFATEKDAARAERELRGAGFPDAIRMPQ
ncbi:MAG: hypothetical protein B7Z10_11845 [Rhodobacterales bacterium 32-66-7]|nr:MAG: hypothetical protein B7Z31_11175 [Rhodobacterales bacterium 12-65-15]OYX23172.1 MAG: hypothetical protein B7Z10_11845 [Rhodobacterales bacterium 32-66-7]